MLSPGATILVFQIFQKDSKIGKEISYFTAALFRQGFEASQTRQILLVVICIILTTAYETLFTSRLIAPVVLRRFENVAQFMNNPDSKIICIQRDRCDYVLNIGTDVRSNFAKHGVLRKMKKSVVLLDKQNFHLGHVEKMSAYIAIKSINNRLVGILMDYSCQTICHTCAIHGVSMPNNIRNY